MPFIMNNGKKEKEAARWLYMSKHSIRTIDQVIERASHYMNEEHVAFLQRAYEYAAKAHEGQIRKSVKNIFYIQFKWQIF